jgi:hypothetical protein
MISIVWNFRVTVKLVIVVSLNYKALLSILKFLRVKKQEKNHIWTLNFFLILI